MKDKKDLHNHTGQMPSDVPGKDLINPPKRKASHKKPDKRSNFNTTAKDPNLGKRNETGR